MRSHRLAQVFPVCSRGTTEDVHISLKCSDWGKTAIISSAIGNQGT